LIPFFDDRVAAWVARNIEGCGLGFGNCRALGVAHNDQLVAGLVFHNWEPDNGLIEISAAATHRGWMTRKVVNTAMEYAFDGLECQAIVARISEANEPARKIWQALGSAEYTIPRLRGRDTAGCIYVLTDDAWQRSRFNEKVNHGKI
jgi:RimJ/RimL family protein N-acetyltransferase